ncbi:MAG: phenylalanine--tRNA ligase subunit beta [Rhodoluna sp.]
MRIPLSWLAEYVDLPGDATPESVMAELVKVGLEEEGSHGFDVSGPVVVGEVLEFVAEPQSNGKTIRWCQVRVAPEGSAAADGGADVRGIVCGASNFELGDKVVVCLPGAVLPGDFKIAARSTYGHISDGMMASARELNLSDDHAGIIRLQTMGLDPKVGTDAIEILHLDEPAAEVNVTPDRGYCLSIRGIAREYSHATGSDFRDPKSNAFIDGGSGYEIKISDNAPIRDRQAVDRFVVRVVKGIDVSRPTPTWMATRLKLAGMRSISLIVDITNYVMLELGQPTHAYDMAKLKGNIGVRRANANETLKTLDGQVRKLNTEDIVIVDDSGAIGLAGVMGGESTEVSSTTTDVVVEAAVFDPISIARSARRHKLSSEASKRFERGVDPKMADNAAARVVQLLEVHAGGAADPLGADVKLAAERTAVWLPANFATELVGVDYSEAEIESVLAQIGCVVAKVSDGFEVIPPTWRPDITHKTDLVEEIARISGYDRIPSRLPVAPPGRGLTTRQKYRRAALNALSGSGMVEVLTYPFVSSAQNAIFDSKNSAAVKLANALQGEADEMRLEILPGLIDAAKRNISRGLVDLAIYEEGLVFKPVKKISSNPELPAGNFRPSASELQELLKTIPNQPRHIAGLFTGNRVAHQLGQKAIEASYVDSLHAVKIISAAVAVELTLKQASPKGFHPGRTAELFVSIEGKETSIGFAGELDPQLAIDSNLPRRVGAFELDLEKLYSAAPAVIQAQQILVMPAATQDLSLVVNSEVPAGDVLATIREGAGALLEQVSIVDDYRGSNVPSGQKSLTFALRFRAEDRTLTQAEASEAKDAAVQLAFKKFGATIRT